MNPTQQTNKTLTPSTAMEPTFTSTTTTPTTKNIYMVVPYIQGLGEKFKRTCNRKGIQVHLKGSNTIKDLLMAPKDKDTRLQKSRVIYQYKCPTINHPVVYIGETGRVYGDRLKEHRRAPPPFTITPAPQDIQLALIALTLFTGNHRAQPDTLGRACTSGSMAHL